MKPLHKLKSIIMHEVDPSLPRFDFVNGEWVKHDPAAHAEPNPDYVSAPMSEDAVAVWFGFPKKEDS